MPTNNEMGVRRYEKEFKDIMPSVFNAMKAFAGAFAPMQAEDGVKDNVTAFYVKTSDSPVVFNEYDTGANVGMGTGTSNSSRFGQRTEVKHIDTPVDYTGTWAFDDGLDRFTVNEELDAAVAERVEVRAKALTRKFNTNYGLHLSNSAGNDITITDLAEATLIEQFGAIAAYYKNIECAVSVTAYVTPELYNALIDADLITTLKNSTVNLDEGTIEMFKGFKIVAEADKYFAEGEIAYFSPDYINIPFLGISTLRALTEVPEFDGTALQGAGKYGAYVNDDNKAAITKIILEQAGG